jgi:centromere/kinetochore protein ZW10
MIRFLSESFPPDFAQPLSSVLMPKLTTLIRETWLDSAVPVSLDRMTDFRNSIALVHEFAETITSLGWGGADNLNDWVESSPRLWVAKRRETALDSTRRQLSEGIGRTKGVERTETQTITEFVEEELPGGAANEGKETAKREDDWDVEWSDDEDKGNDEDGAPGGDKGKAKEKNTGGGSDSEGNTGSSSSLGRDSPKENNWTAGVLKDAAPDDDDGADAWGWGDEDEEEAPAETEEQPAPAPVPEKPEILEPQARREVQREVTLTEKYTVSSMPEPVFNTISQIIEDGVTLTREK